MSYLTGFGLKLSDAFCSEYYTCEDAAMLAPKQLDNLELVVLPIKSESGVKAQGDVESSKVLGLSHSERSAYDSLLGISMSILTKDRDEGLRFRLGQTPSLVMPVNVAAVIFAEWTMGDGRWRESHVGSPLIDPGFGRGSNDGLPIRIERLVSGPGREDPKKILMRLYRA